MISNITNKALSGKNIGYKPDYKDYNDEVISNITDKDIEGKDVGYNLDNKDGH